LGSTGEVGSTQRASSELTKLRDAIEARLSRFERIAAPQPLVSAAVAVVVLEDGDGEALIPLLLRPAGLASHPGQFALPGGKLHSGESAEAGALRELSEELGLAAGSEAILGVLDDFDTRSGFTITPVVMWSRAAAAQLRPSETEVAELFLLKPADLRSAVRSAKRGTSRAFCLELPWGPVYAPTAAILYQFSEVALDGRATRVNDFYQPPFARR
jgi:8-oxo-dGTP pyrophosphatase MutT (NUDIX family)